MIKTSTYNSAGQKWCGNCKEYHALCCFGKNRKAKDGIHYVCLYSRKKKPTDKVEPQIIFSDPSIINLAENIDSPILKSQVLYFYKRPDFYDMYISKTINL